MKKFVLLASFVLVVLAGVAVSGGEEKPVPIPPSPQRLGDADRGYSYLVTGDYVKSGLPYGLLLMGMTGRPVLLNREGLNQKLPHDFTAVKAANGEVLAAPNCLQCHAQVFDGQLVMGLGNSLIDFSKGQQALNEGALAMMENYLKKSAPKQYEAALPFLTATKAIGPQMRAATRGVNMADRLTGLLVAHRDPLSFRWIAEPAMDIPDEAIPTDTPPWWLLKKKNAMFYNGFGRGDFGRFLMASNLLTVNDTAESREVFGHMPDLLAYLYSLEPPKYPKPVNAVLAARGKAIFTQNCSGCHGSYGQNGSYPNLLIPESIVATDSFLFRSNYSNPQFVDWFNRSWFTQGEHPARLVPFRGYIAPPLDGIWISAPYLHNGSVPTLEALLNSRLRPARWSRDFEKPQYDYQKIGWVYTVEKEAEGPKVYDTALPGYGNYGHYFGDALSDKDRKAVIEYLKTL